MRSDRAGRGGVNADGARFHVQAPRPKAAGGPKKVQDIPVFDLISGKGGKHPLQMLCSTCIILIKSRNLSLFN